MESVDGSQAGTLLFFSCRWHLAVHRMKATGELPYAAGVPARLCSSPCFHSGNRLFSFEVNFLQKLLNQWNMGRDFPVLRANSVVHAAPARQSCASPPAAEGLSIISHALETLATNCMGQAGAGKA